MSDDVTDSGATEGVRIAGRVDSAGSAAIRGGGWARLSTAAWQMSNQARVHGETRVGAAVLSAEGEIFGGCNVEHRFRSHDVHAEVNALTNMVAAGHSRAVAILIASDRESFTPCGGCLDWIFELGGPDCVVAFQGRRGGPLAEHRADELMPYYPR